MNEKRTSVFENSLIWFGAAVSLAEILTGTYFAPLGFSKGLLAIILGHIFGCALLFAAGLIGAFEQKSAMETVKASFGSRGALLFSVLNILQLVGWTAIMIYDGALAAEGIFSLGHIFWSILIGALIIVWILVGIKSLGKINTIAMSLLFILTVILSFVIFRENTPSAPASDTISFGAAVELSVAMPLSWLPLISDYTREAAKPVRATVASAITYGIVSSWMYIIGMSAALFTGESDIADIMMKAGLGIAGLLIIVFSTVTTTFLDAYSAGISSETLSTKLNGKRVAIVTAVFGILGSVFLPLYDITGFLYLIGSVFAPMIAILITDYFILKNDRSGFSFGISNIFVWIIGFAVYQFLMKCDIIIGNTLPDMVITSLLCIAVNKTKRTLKK